MDEDRAGTWIEALASVVAGLRSNETISELVSQAREGLGELRAQSGRDEGEAQRGGAEGSGASVEANAVGARFVPDGDALVARLDVLSASVEELTDLLDAGLERLETVEMQLGDPDDNVDALITAAVEGCQSRLAAIEHRLQGVASTLRDGAVQPIANGRGGWRVGAPHRPAADELVVLVVDGHSQRRCDLCLALEHEGLRCVAVCDVGAAAGAMRTLRPDVILLDVGTDPEEVAALSSVLEEFGVAAAPPVLVVSGQRLVRSRAAAVGECFGAWPLVCGDEGDAALAAAVIEHTRRAAAADLPARQRTEKPTEKPTEEFTPDVFEAESRVSCDGPNDGAFE